VEIHNGHTIMSTRNLENFGDNLKLPVTGGSDAHLLDEIGAVTMTMDGDPIDSILSGNSKISVNISKYKILRNFIKRRILRLKK
jgi:hypothetical protein